MDQMEEFLKVTWVDQQSKQESSGEFNTVVLAVGRRADTEKLGLDKAGVRFDESTGKIPVDKYERTNIRHIYAIGDVVKGNLELTPVAIKSGRLLARRLYTKGKILMDYKTVPTTVFTPLEYSAVGYTEEDAIQKFGKDNVEVYHTFYKPLEWTVAEREDNVCYVKLLCNLADNERVLGVHILGPNSGEMVQGLATAIKCGATKEMIDQTVGIHPTTAEEIFQLTVTKRSGLAPIKKGC